uniref:Probable DNA polymerase n=1 Tax=Porodaedalea pini TaxID=108901 RepID=A0A5B9RJN0_9AGAM|nr:DNA polymerase family B [Porodaedalea pini]QEG56957.1 DNA polymerase family B [Porodaedalea pini]
MKKMKPVCVSIFDGKLMKSFYLLDFISEEAMLEASIKFLMVRKYKNYRINLHNFSYFDAVFLLNVLSNLATKIKPIIRDNQIIDLKFYFENNENNETNSLYTLYFRDSYLLLPSSLDKLAKSFNTVPKGIFPYKFINNPLIKLDHELPKGVGTFLR